MNSRIITKIPALKKALSLFCLVSFVFLQALSASPVLHCHFHHDAGKADHNCVVTMLSQGNVITAAAVPFIQLPSVFVIESPAALVSVSVSVDYQLLPGRAPPSFLA
jgi:hypothetical protein